MIALWIALLLAPAGEPASQSRASAPAPSIGASAREPAKVAVVDLSDPAELAACAQALEAEDDAVRESAIEKLARAPKALVIPVIKVSLGSPREETRLAAVSLVRRHQATVLARDVSRILDRDRSERVRREACHAVLDLKPKDAVRTLREVMLGDESVVVRRAAINDLGRLRSVEAAEALLEGFAWISDEAEPDYLLGHVTNALTFATGKSFGRNLEAWQFHVADLRRLADAEEAVGSEEAGAEDAVADDAEPVEEEPVPTTGAEVTEPSSGGR